VSLKRFIAMPDVKAKLKALRPQMPRRVNVPLKVAPRTARFALVGTAFDYLLRFEIQRRAPHASVSRLIAESAPDVVWKEVGPGAAWIQVPGAEDDDPLDPGKTARELAVQLRKIIEDARRAVAAYVQLPAPTRIEQEEIAAKAICLAKLDELYRSQRLVSGYGESSAEDVEDLLALLGVVPFDALLHSPLVLNPSFGESSRLLAGADADMIDGDLLLDFKTTKEAEIKAEALDQLLEYFLLACRERRTNPSFPAVNRVGLYFSRHGHLWTIPTTVWTDQSLFPDLDTWFFARAAEAFGKKPRTARILRDLQRRS